MPGAVVPQDAAATPVTQVRSTLLQASIHGLKRHGLYERWLTLVDPTARDAIVEAIAPAWLPVQLGIAHYEGCDKLNVDARQLEAIGADVGQRIQGILATTAAKVARAAGLTPDVAMHSFRRLWPRLFIGGTMQAALTGPKDMTISLQTAVLTRYAYFRGTFCGNVLAACKLVGVRAVHAKPLRYDVARDRFEVQLSWV